jgi:hypothetical protein
MPLTHNGSQQHLYQIYSPDLSGGDDGIQIVTTDASAKPATHAAVWDENGNVVAGGSSSGTVPAGISVNGVGVSNDDHFTPGNAERGHGSGTALSITGSVVGVGGAMITGGQASIVITATGVRIQTATTHSGKWSVGRLPAGTYTITPSQPGYTFSPASKSVTIGTANVATTPFTATLVTSGSGSTSVADQIYADMTGANEEHPHGVPSSYDFYSGPVITQGNNIGTAQALEWWAALYVGPSGNPSAPNTKVAVKNAQLWWLRASTGQWVEGMAPTSTIDGGYYSEDFVTDLMTSISFRSEGDGSVSFITTSGEVGHVFAPFPRIPVDPTDLGGVVSVLEAKLILDDAMGTDDRSSADFVLGVGADAYPATTGAGIEANPGLGGGKFKLVATSWRSCCMTTMTQAALRLIPPPIDFTGISI